MANVDAAKLAQLALKLGLVTNDQLEEVWEELGLRGGPAEPWLRLMERRNFLTPYQTGKLLKGDSDGFVLGGYRLLYKIASGSFGRVYRADDPRTGTIVAIKVLRRKWSEDKHNVELFEREGKMGMTLRHPNIVEILAVNRDPVSRSYYIVMEFVEGGNLRDFLGIRKKLDPAETLRILEDVVSGLAYAYSKGFSHRDMKLTNVLISSQGVAKLVDFGLAGDHGPTPAALAATRDKDDPLQVDRTVDYAGLEKATGVSSGDIRSDIFFLGCVVYELLTGRGPLEMPKDPRARMHKERFLRVKPMTRDEVNGPPGVFRLVETMMALNSLERYQTPSQLLDAIRLVRRELEGKNGNKTPILRTLFIVEKDERLQDALREKFKEWGFRVLMAADPTRAVDRFRQQPFDALIVDAGTTGQDGTFAFDHIIREGKRQQHPCAGILILSESQADWAERVESGDTVAVLVRPVTLKQLRSKILELLGEKGE